MGKGIIIGTNNSSSITEKLDQIYEKLNHSVGDASDSTANPSNVDEGCIFYNKDGRNIGTLQKMEGVTITPTESVQTIRCNDKHMTSDCKINAIPPNHIGSGITKQAAKTVTPTESEQIAVKSGVYTTGDVKVGAISDTYIGSKIKRNDEIIIDPEFSEQIIPVAGSYMEGNLIVAPVGKNEAQNKSFTGVITGYGPSNKIKIGNLPMAGYVYETLQQWGVIICSILISNQIIGVGGYRYLFFPTWQIYSFTELLEYWEFNETIGVGVGIPANRESINFYIYAIDSSILNKTVELKIHRFTTLCPDIW